MADTTIKLIIIAQDQATQQLRSLNKQLTELTANSDKVIRQRGEWAFERQLNNVLEKIESVKNAKRDLDNQLRNAQVAQQGTIQEVIQQGKFVTPNGQLSNAFGGINSYTDQEIKARERLDAAIKRGEEQQKRSAERAAAANIVALNREMEVKRNLAAKNEEIIGNAAIRAAYEREKTEQIVYEQALRDNREFYRQRYGVTVAEPGDRNFGAIAPAQIWSLPSYVQMQAWEGQRQAVESMRSMRGAEGGSISRILSRLNRQGALEGQAAVINSVQALAAGMNPVQVAVMEGAQLGGAAIQGGLISLKDIFSAMTSPLGLVVTGFAAVATGLIVLAMSALRASEQIARAANQTAFRGASSVNNAALIETLQKQIQSSGGMGRQESRELAATVVNIPNISNAARQNLALSGEAISAMRFQGNNVETNKFLTNAFSSVGKMEELQKETGLLKGEFKQTFEAAVGIGDSITASTLLAQGMADRVKLTTEALKATRQEMGTLGRNLDIFGLNFEEGLKRQLAKQGLPSRGYFEAPLFQPGTSGSTETEKKGGQAADNQLKFEREINGLILQRQNLLKSIDLAQEGAGKDRLNRALIENNEALANARTPQEDREHAAKLARLEALKQEATRAANSDITQSQRVLNIQKQIQEEITNYRYSAAARRESITVSESEAEIRAAQQVSEAIYQEQQRRLSVSLAKSGVRQAQIGPANLPAQREELQNQLATMQQLQAGETAVEGKKAEIINLDRQIKTENENVRIAYIQQSMQLAQARQELWKIVELEKQRNAIIQSSPNRTPIEKVQSQSAVIQAELNSLQRSIQLRQQLVDTTNRFQNQRAGTIRSFNTLEVEQRNKTAEEATRADTKLTQAASSEQRKRLNDFLTIEGLTVDQKVQTFEKLANLYEQDAQKQLNLQRQLTQKINQQNEQRLQSFKNFFDSVGSSASQLLIAGLNKTQTRGQALKNFGQSLVSSFVSNAANMASQFAGRGIASGLNVNLKTGEDSSIGAVLSKAIGQWTGLAKPVPKTDVAQISELLNSANSMQQKAAQLQIEAALELKAAAGNLKGNGPVSNRKIPEFQQLEQSNKLQTGTLEVNTAALKRLTEVLNLAAQSLPAGYKVETTSTVRPNSSLAGSFHRTGEAVDVRIIDAAGNVIRNRGADDTGMYERLAVAGYRINQEKFPGTNFTWGGRFETSPGSGESDLMHFDAGPDRGKLRSPLSEISANYGPLQIANIKESTSTLSSGLNLAGSAAQMFGGRLSQSGQMIIGGFNLLDQGLGFAGRLGSVFNTTTSATQAMSAATSIAQTAEAANTAATITNTVATQINSSAQAASGATSAASGIGGGLLGGGLLKAIPFIGGFFERGGIVSAMEGMVVPSAAGGMIMDNSGGVNDGKGGRIGILHPKEMVLPSPISSGLINLINNGGLAGDSRGGDTNSGGNTLIYNSNITGYNPYESRNSFEGMLRKHGDLLMGYLENAARNGWRG